MSKDEWQKIAIFLNKEADRLSYNITAQTIITSLGLLAVHMGRKTSNELLSKAAEYGNSLR